jgi:hypothetical protein
MRPSLLTLCFAALVLLAAPAGTAVGDNSWALPGFTSPKPKLAKYKFDYLPLGTGVSGSFLAANDNSEAVGIEGSGTMTYAIYYNRGTVTDLQGTLGTGYLDGIDALGNAAGQSNGHPVYYPVGGPPITLDVSGTASAITLGPLVAVSISGSSASSGTTPQMSELWNPVSDAVVPLGNVQVGGLDVGGWAVGQTDAGMAWYAQPGSGGTISQTTLSFPGYFRGITNWNWAYGFRIEHGDPRPILDELGISPNKFIDFKLTPHYKIGSLVYVSDGGFAIGEEYKSLAAFKDNDGMSLLYPNGPDHPIVADDALRLPSGTRLDLLSGTNNNFLFGDAELRGDGGRLFAALLPPAPYEKLDYIDEILWWDESLPTGDPETIHSDVVAIRHELDDDDYEDACDDIDSLGTDLDNTSGLIDDYYGDWAAETVDTYDEVANMLDEVYWEIKCPQPLTIPTFDLSPQQSPFFGGLLVPTTTVTTTVGPPTISSP